MIVQKLVSIASKHDRLMRKYYAVQQSILPQLVELETLKKQIIDEVKKHEKTLSFRNIKCSYREAYVRNSWDTTNLLLQIENHPWLKDYHKPVQVKATATFKTTLHEL